MKLNKKAVLYTPKNEKKGDRVNLCISAHQDDIEIMAYHGIIDAYNSLDKVFVACVTTDGAGSARSGKYASFTDDDMKLIRVEEQKKASEIGHYNKLYLLPRQVSPKTCRAFFFPNIAKKRGIGRKVCKKLLTNA